jgi:hypothetical protein
MRHLVALAFLMVFPASSYAQSLPNFVKKLFFNIDFNNTLGLVEAYRKDSLLNHDSIRGYTSYPPLSAPAGQEVNYLTDEFILKHHHPLIQSNYEQASIVVKTQISHDRKETPLQVYLLVTFDSKFKLDRAYQELLRAASAFPVSKKLHTEKKHQIARIADSKKKNREIVLVAGPSKFFWLYFFWKLARKNANVQNKDASNLIWDLQRLYPELMGPVAEMKYYLIVGFPKGVEALSDFAE